MRVLRPGRSRARKLALASGLVAVLAGCLPAPTLAAFPGRDGAIAFTITDAYGNQTIQAVDPTSGRRHRLTAVTPGCARLRKSWMDDVPAFSASGRHLYYSHSGDCRRMPDGLYRIPVGGGPPRLVVRDRAGLITWWPAPTAGGRLLFINDLPISPRRDPDEFQDRIYSSPATGGRPRRLSQRRATSDEFPAVSSTGRVAFSQGHRRLVAARVRGGLTRGLRTLASMPRGTFASSDWSPGGRRLVFEYQPGGKRFRSDIYLVGARGGRIRRLTRAHNAVSPVWSPSGRWIAFSRSPEQHPSTGPLYIIRPNGRGLRKILGSIDETRLSWQPLPRSR